MKTITAVGTKKKKKMSDRTKWQHWKNMLSRLEWVKKAQEKGTHKFKMDSFLVDLSIEEIPHSCKTWETSSKYTVSKLKKNGNICRSGGCFFGECFIEFYKDAKHVVSFDGSGYLDGKTQCTMIKFVSEYLGLSTKGFKGDNGYSTSRYVYLGAWATESLDKDLEEITVDDAIAYVKKVLKTKKIRVTIDKDDH